MVCAGRSREVELVGWSALAGRLLGVAWGVEGGEVEEGRKSSRSSSIYASLFDSFANTIPS